MMCPSFDDRVKLAHAKRGAKRLSTGGGRPRKPHGMDALRHLREDGLWLLRVVCAVAQVHVAAEGAPRTFELANNRS